MICKKLSNIDIQSINNLFNNSVYKNIIYTEYIFYINRIQNINNRNNIIDYIDYFRIDFNRNQTKIDIDIFQNTEINNISIDFYRIITAENQDQKNNIIIYKN